MPANAPEGLLLYLRLRTSLDHPIRASVRIVDRIPKTTIQAVELAAIATNIATFAAPHAIPRPTVICRTTCCSSCVSIPQDKHFSFAEASPLHAYLRPLDTPLPGKYRCRVVETRGGFQEMDRLS
jgi:hypothetical protein